MSEPTDIGQQLLKARELKNLAISDIEQSTRIPSATINALEINDYSNLPTSYARSFLVQYSEYLEVDASELIQSLVPNEDIANIGYLKSNQDTVSEKSGASSRTRFNKKRGKGQNQLRSSSTHTDGKKMAQPLAIIGLTLLLIMAISFFYNKYQSQPSSPVQSSSKNDEHASDQLQAKFDVITSGPIADQKTTVEGDMTDIFDPIPTPQNKLSPRSTPSSLAELAGFPDNISPDQNTAVPSDNDDEIDADSIVPQRNSPPPKAMVIDESEE